MNVTSVFAFMNFPQSCGMGRFFAVIAAFLLSLVAGKHAFADYSDDPEVNAFIDQMVRDHEMERRQLEALFAATSRSERVLELIQKPAEKRLDWGGYRPIFLTDARIDAGVDFWKAHTETLEKAQLRYGVPASVIVAIIGVETYYGRISGGFSAMSALTTLAFEFPRRSKFFRKELEEFLLLVRENNLDAAALEGSYAGAFGLPQFISSSYRNYAVDFDDNGETDLWNSVPDAVGSVANYLYRHGWKNGQIVAEPVAITGPGKALVRDSPKPVHSLTQLNQAGIYPKRKGSGKYTLLKLQAEELEEFWVAHQNFYVITRYNHSNLYAMAVYQLSREIQSRMSGRQ